MDTETVPQETSLVQSLDDFQRAFVATGRICEIRRSGVLVFPKVGKTEYDVVISGCECSGLEVYYLSDPDRRCGQLYSVCVAHGLQPLGRATHTRVTRGGRSQRLRIRGLR